MTLRWFLSLSISICWYFFYPCSEVWIFRPCPLFHLFLHLVTGSSSTCLILVYTRPLADGPIVLLVLLEFWSFLMAFRSMATWFWNLNWIGCFFSFRKGSWFSDMCGTLAALRSYFQTQVFVSSFKTMHVIVFSCRPFLCIDCKKRGCSSGLRFVQKIAYSWFLERIIHYIQNNSKDNSKWYPATNVSWNTRWAFFAMLLKSLIAENCSWSRRYQAHEQSWGLIEKIKLLLIYPRCFEGSLRARSQFDKKTAPALETIKSTPSHTVLSTCRSNGLNGTE